MVEALTTSFSNVVGYVGDFVNALVTTEGELAGLLPLVTLGVAITLFSFGTKIVKSFTWGA